MSVRERIEKAVSHYVESEHPRNKIGRWTKLSGPIADMLETHLDEQTVTGMEELSPEVSRLASKVRRQEPLTAPQKRDIVTHLEDYKWNSHMRTKEDVAAAEEAIDVLSPRGGPKTDPEWRARQLDRWAQGQDGPGWASTADPALSRINAFRVRSGKGELSAEEARDLGLLPGGPKLSDSGALLPDAEDPQGITSDEAGLVAELWPELSGAISTAAAAGVNSMSAHDWNALRALVKIALEEGFAGSPREVHVGGSVTGGTRRRLSDDDIAALSSLLAKLNGMHKASILKGLGLPWNPDDHPRSLQTGRWIRVGAKVELPNGETGIVSETHPGGMRRRERSLSYWGSPEGMAEDTTAGPGDTVTVRVTRNGQEAFHTGVPAENVRPAQRRRR